MGYNDRRKLKGDSDKNKGLPIGKPLFYLAGIAARTAFR
jgi:hypothetical protein